MTLPFLPRQRAGAGAARAEWVGPSRAQRKPRLRPALRWVHRTLGLFAAFYVLIASATGAVLLFRQELLALAFPNLPGPPADPVGRAERLAARLEPGSFTSIKFPTDELPAFTVYLPHQRTALFDPATLAPLEDRYGALRAMDWIFDLHHHLLVGETGEIVSGLFGVAVAGLVLIGLYLWWPWRRGWRLAHARPRRATRSAQLGAHTTLAVVAAPALMLAALSGAGLVFHDQARGLLTALFGERDPAVVPADAAGSLSTLARATFPAAEPRLLIPPRSPGDATTLRLRQPQERHPNGRTTVAYDPASARLTGATSEPRSGTGNRLFNLLYPLHIGSLGGLPLRLLLLLSAPIALLAALRGLRAWFAGRRRGRPQASAALQPPFSSTTTSTSGSA